MTTETRFGHVLVSVRPDMHVASCGMHRGIPSPVLPKSKPETQLKLRNGSFYSGTVNIDIQLLSKRENSNTSSMALIGGYNKNCTQLMGVQGKQHYSF